MNHRVIHDDAEPRDWERPMTGATGTPATTVIGRDDVAAVIAAVGLDRLMDEMIEELTTSIVTFDDSVTKVRTRDGFHYSHPEIGLIEWMPVMQSGESTTIKVVGYHPGNPRSRQLPTILATISVYDTGTGHLRGLVDGTFLTAVRTGAASAVASRVLARPSSHILGVVGCGAQAVTQIHALVRTFPIDQVLVYDGNAGESPQEFNVTVPGRKTSVTVPRQFLQPNTEYKIEVLAIEKSGNQTITEGEFSTGPKP